MFGSSKTEIACKKGWQLLKIFALQPRRLATQKARKNRLKLIKNCNQRIAQVLIAEGDNTAQYWPNLGSQESAIVIGPVSLFESVKCWADDDGLFWLFKFTDLQPILGPVSALYQADSHFYYGIQFWK